MAGNRYYYYDPEDCAFVEMKADRSRLYKVAGLLVVSAIILSTIFIIGFDGLIGTPQELALKAENEALQQQLVNMGNHMEQFSEELAELSEADRGIYRALLEAEPISDDVRQVGVGGTDPYERYSRFGLETASLLRESSETLDRLEREINLQNSSYRELSKLAAERKAWLEEMPAILPTNGPVISGYGVRRHPILRISRMHPGIDVAVLTGTPVFVTGNGVVRKTDYSSTYGRHIEVEHPATGYRTVYAHLSKISDHIRVGRTVTRGEQIGLSGSTGLSSGPHLHYEVRDPDGNTLNPVHFFAPSMTPSQYKALLAQAEQSTLSLD